MSTIDATVKRLRATVKRINANIERSKVELGIDRRKEVVDATSDLEFRIKPEHIARATPRDPCNCVIAQAIRAVLGDLFDNIYVGLYVTKIETPTKIIRFATPPNIRKQLPIFDKLRLWHLPPGEYALTVLSDRNKLSGRPHRWKAIPRTKTGGGQDGFKNYSAPSRNVPRVVHKAMND